MTEKCKTPGPLVMGVNKTSKKVKLWRPPCRRWSCEQCRENLANEWAFAAFYGAKELQEQSFGLAFITITSHERLSPEMTISVWPSAWRKLYMRVRRKYGAGEYFMTSERHKDRRLHVHALVTWDIEHNWLKNAARACGLGYMAHVREVDHPLAAAAYASKYLTKFGDVWPRGWRRVRLSRGWPRISEMDNPPGWTFAPLSSTLHFGIDAWRSDWESAGYTVFIAEDVRKEFGGASR